VLSYAFGGNSAGADKIRQTAKTSNHDLLMLRESVLSISSFQDVDLMEKKPGIKIAIKSVIEICGGYSKFAAETQKSKKSWTAKPTAVAISRSVPDLLILGSCERVDAAESVKKPSRKTYIHSASASPMPIAKLLSIIYL
jgi:hypothetical protein